MTSFMAAGTRAELIEAINQHYIHGRITYRELLRFKILHHFRRGNLDYAADLAQLERGEDGDTETGAIHESLQQAREPEGEGDLGGGGNLPVVRMGGPEPRVKAGKVPKVR
jgi:hypothetical protein